MNDKIIFTLVGTIFAGVITVLGWFITNYLAKRKEFELKRKTALIEHLKRQIDEFYAPLLGLCISSRFAFETSSKQLPMKTDGYDFEKFTENDWEIYDFYSEEYFLPTNSNMAELINTKMSLLEENKLPKSFEKFLKHRTEYECLHKNYKIKKISRLGKKQPYEVIAKESAINKILVEDYPTESENFEKTIRDSLKRIEQKYHNYLKGLEKY